MRRTQDTFQTVKTEGAILPADLLRRIVDGDTDVPGLSPEDYHLAKSERLNEAATRAWNRLQGAWEGFKEAMDKLPESDAGTSLTRERWLLILFQELGYGRLMTRKAYEIEGKSYPISHEWQNTPIHLVSFRQEIDKRTPGRAGAARVSPHSLVQELLSRSDDHLWGFVSNGLTLRLLRDNVSLTRQAYVEFDLQAMMDSEAYSDFFLLFLLCHQSRVEVAEGKTPESCWLEKWCNTAAQQGVRALDQLRDGVQNAIEALGGGFLAHPANAELREKLRSGRLSTQDYYRQILRQVYRLLFLFVAEDRDLLFDPRAPTGARKLYTDYYSTQRLRSLAAKTRGTRHPDLWRVLRIVLSKLYGGCQHLAVPALGSFLFAPQSTADLNDADIPNSDLLKATRSLAFTIDRNVLRPVNYRHLGPEELGSVYESLLEMHPAVQMDATNPEDRFKLTVATGSERKTTGSYYTPTSLVNCLLDSALDPVLDEACRKDNPEQALLDLKICDPACGSGHFLIAAAHRTAKRLAAIRAGEDEPSPGHYQHALRDVISRCIYGVDINPMSVELCKVSLWIEALEPGKPLAFLDHHIQCGNSLLGTTPELIAAGLPEGAFTAIDGDDKKACAVLKKRNKAERSKDLEQLYVQHDVETQARLQQAAAALEELPHDRPEDILAKELAFCRHEQTEEYRRKKQLADTWCAAFVLDKHFPPLAHDPRFSSTEPSGITQRHLNDLATGRSLPADLNRTVEKLLGQYQFFHWHLAFPEVFVKGGFDCMLGNPPWDTLSPDQREFFGKWIGGLRSMAPEEQQEEISRLLADVNIATQWTAHCRELFALVHFLKHSGVFTLYAYGNLGKGDFNIYRMFVETALRRIRPGGSASQVVPAGFYGGANASAIRKFIFDQNRLVFLAGCENKGAVFFPGVHPQTWFAIYAVRRGGRTEKFRATFGVDSLEKSLRVFADAMELEADVIRQNAPNTYAIPDLRNLSELTMNRKMRTACPAFGNASLGPPMRHYSRELDMGNDRDLFTTNPAGLPVYEGRMIDLFDHRAKTYQSGHGNSAVWIEREFGDPAKAIVPQWRVLRESTPSKLGDRYDSYRIGFGDVANPRNERSFVATLIPPGVICGDKVPTLDFGPGQDWFFLPWLAVANSFTMDWLARACLTSPKMAFSLLDGLPFPRPAISDDFIQNVAPVVLRLVCTAPEMTAFWNRMAKLRLVESVPDDTVPHSALVDPASRAEARAELDAFVAARVFGLSRQELSDQLDTFDVLRRREEKMHGKFLTKQLILDAFKRLI